MHVKLSLRLIIFSLLICLLAFNAQSVSALTAVDPAQSVVDAIAYLKSQQQPDGGIMGFAGTSDPDTTIRTLLALAVNAAAWTDFTSTEGKTMVDYLASQADTYVHDPNGLLFPGRAGLLLSAVALSGGDVYNFGGLDLVSELEAAYQPAIGAYATEASLDYSSGAASDLNQGWAILGLALAGQPIPTPATFYLASTQAEDGSWVGGDPDTTALVLTALLASHNVPLEDAMVTKAFDFFKATQLPSGGWKPAWDQDPLNADTTGWVAQALASAQQAPVSESWAASDGNPLSALLSLAKEDGSIGGTYVNAYSTADALIGLGKTPLVALTLPPAFQRAALVVQTSDGNLLTACVAYTEESLTGFELLSRSGLEVASITDPSLGTAVCGIEDQGCPSSDCFCGMPEYWSYWQSSGGDWAYAVSGSDHTVVTDGAIEAWSWGEGVPPALLTFNQVCQPGSLQPASVAVQSVASAPTLEPAPAATAAVESYPEPAVNPTTEVQTYPEPADAAQPAADEAYPEPDQTQGVLGSALPYVFLFGLLVILFIGVLILARRKK